MVSFWPWKGDDGSPASFEKALSSLSEKISKTSTKLDGLRQRSRRLTGLLTLYSIFLYLLYSVILVLVVGWRNWGIAEYAAVLGGPFIFYLLRLALTSYYQYRTSNVQRQLDDLQSQRDTTIKKLKSATKYDTTQELLKKYGGTPTPKPKPSNGSDRKASSKQGDTSNPGTARTGFVPPPTANIPGRNLPSPAQGGPQDSTSQQSRMQGSPVNPSPPWQQHRRQTGGSAEFAPNAFPTAPQYAPADDGPRWYDKFMDLLLGEDETLPGKRMALICSNCRLVNGQAPPGMQRLEDIGKWRCMGCGTMNGEDNDEVKKIVASIRQEKSKDAKKVQHKQTTGDGGSETEAAQAKPATPRPLEVEEDSDVTQYSTDDNEPNEDEGQRMKDPIEISKKKTDSVDTPKRRSTRNKKS